MQNIYLYRMPKVKTERLIAVSPSGKREISHVNLIYDVVCGAIEEPSLLADALKSVTGVVEHGLFLDLADEALVGTDKGVERLTP